MSKKSSKQKSSKKHTGKKKPQQRPGAVRAQQTPQIRLSQCMIVKDEEKNIEQALAWGKGVVCEQIVVDTGSTDRTVEIAESMGATVLHFEWIDDFAAAKNYAIEHASGNWIAFLDADEYFPPEDAAKLIKVLESIHFNKNLHFVRSKMANVNSDGSMIAAFPQDRVFRNDVRMRYRGRIHEQLYFDPPEEVGCYDAQEMLLIIHTGYSDEVNKPEKGERNARLLEKEMERDPTDGTRLMYLGDAYNMAERDDEALECYRRVLWDPNMKMNHSITYLRAGLQILRLRNGEPPEDTEEEYLQVSEALKRRCGDSHPDIDYYLGFMNLKKNDVKKAADLFESALEKLKRYTGADVAKMTSDLALPNYVVAANALNERNPQKAVAYAVEALKVDKFSPDGLKMLLLAFATEHKAGMSIEPYWNFLYKIYHMNEPKDLLFIWKMAQDTNFTAMKERAYEALPPQLQERVRG